LDTANSTRASLDPPRRLESYDFSLSAAGSPDAVVVAASHSIGDPLEHSASSVREAGTMQIAVEKSAMAMHVSREESPEKASSRTMAAAKFSNSSGGHNRATDSGDGPSALSSSRADVVYTEAAENHSLAQLLGIEGGEMCPRLLINGIRSGSKHGCRLGCHCGMLQHCNSMTYASAAFQAVRYEDMDNVDVGMCSVAFHALFEVFAALVLSLWLGALLLRRFFPSEDDGRGKLGATRSMLEKRLRTATSLSEAQREAILDEFCGKREGTDNSAANTPLRST